MQKKSLTIVLIMALAFIAWAVHSLGWLETHTAFTTKDNQYLVFNADETLVAATARGEGIHLWNTSERGIPRRLVESDLAKPLCFRSDGQTLLASQDGHLIYWLSNGAKMTLGKDTNRPRRQSVRSAAFSQDDSLIAVLQDNHESTLQVVTQYDTMTMKEWQGVSHFAWCQQDVIAISFNNQVELWSVNGQKKLCTWRTSSTKEENHVKNIVGLCYSAADKTLLWCQSDGSLFASGTSPDSVYHAEHDGQPKRPYTNISTIMYGSLRTWGTSPLYVGAMTNNEVKVWRFYGGKLEPLSVQTDTLGENEHFMNLSPSARWTTIRRYKQGNGHVQSLVKVRVTIPTNR